ncbi:longevity assurance proteins LAG1/LAC1 [Peniophora sp. CONT]|nr:longevity assurance proteins LAG1/LAC1 [Peniophora sp. CONT]
MDALSALSRQALPSFLVPFVTLSYEVPAPAHPDSFPNSSHHDIGYKDVCLMVTLIAGMALLRDATRVLVLEPFAHWMLTRRWRMRKAAEGGDETPNLARADADSKAESSALGPKKPSLERLVASSREARRIRHDVVRFAEQGWMWIYYVFMFSFGMYVYFGLPADPWTGYPHTPLPAPVKLYYLWQMGFYLHSVLVLNAEARRKDHWQMMTHHVVTIALQSLSYSYNLTRIGCLVMVVMDCCDLIFPVAKMLRYLGYQTACDLAFVTFMMSWLYTRHFLFVRIIWSTAFDLPVKVPMVWEPERGSYMSLHVVHGFVAMLCALEVIQMVWCFMIFRVAYRVVAGQGADDSRSDDEE